MPRPYSGPLRCFFSGRRCGVGNRGPVPANRRTLPVPIWPGASPSVARSGARITASSGRRRSDRCRTRRCLGCRGGRGRPERRRALRGRRTGRTGRGSCRGEILPRRWGAIGMQRQRLPQHPRLRVERHTQRPRRKRPWSQTSSTRLSGAPPRCKRTGHSIPRASVRGWPCPGRWKSTGGKARHPVVHWPVESACG